MTPVCIYALCDEQGRARYVGQTRRPAARLAQHLKDDSGSIKSRWVAECAARGVVPTMILLEKVPVEQAQRAERRWIARFLKRYPDLCNVAFGWAIRQPYVSRIRIRCAQHVEVDRLWAEAMAADGCDSEGKPVTAEAIAFEEEALAFMTASRVAHTASALGFAMKKASATQADAAKWCRVSERTIRDWLAGRAPINLRAVLRSGRLRREFIRYLRVCDLKEAA